MLDMKLPIKLVNVTKMTMSDTVETVQQTYKNKALDKETGSLQSYLISHYTN